MIDEWGKGAKYWDHAWNPMIGCKAWSEGCENCYAASMAERFPELQDANGGFDPHPPKQLKRPPKTGVVFVGNMTDLFGRWNSDDEIKYWLSLLSTSANNLILTKRTHRLAARYSLQPNWHFGMTAENQKQYDARIKDFRNFMQTGVPWLSAEPLLGPIDLRLQYTAPEDLPFGWVVVGAESGPKRRPCNLEWVRQIVYQCVTRKISVFVKQLDIDGQLVKDIQKFPKDLQIREMPWSWLKWRRR